MKRITHGAVCFNPAANPQFSIYNEPLDLAPKKALMFYALFRANGKALSTRQLSKMIKSSPTVVRRFICEIRQELDDSVSIETVEKNFMITETGYRLNVQHTHVK